MKEDDEYSVDYPIYEMIDSAQKTKDIPSAILKALCVLEDLGGYIILPSGGGAGWRPDVKVLVRRVKRTLNKNALPTRKG